MAISARKWVDDRGTPSSVVDYAHTAASSEKMWILTCRVSSCEQDWKGTMQRQVVWGKTQSDLLGMPVVGVLCHVGSGFDPSWLAPAVRMAKLINAGLVTRSVNRAVRNPDYHSRLFRSAQARDTDLHELNTVISGVRMATLLDPDASYEVEHQYEIDSGEEAGKMIASGSWSPRGREDRRIMMQPMALALYKQGYSLREVETLVAPFSGHPYLFDPPDHTTIRRWATQAA